MGRDTVQLETAVTTISPEYLLEFTSEYGISEALHPELPGLEDRIVDFLEGKVGVYTKFFEFANFRLPLSQFLFDILGYYQIHLSQMFVIGAAKISHFEINCRVLNIVHTLSLFRVFYTPFFNSGWMSFSKRSGKNTPQCYTKPLDFLKNWNNRFFWVDERVFPTIVDWRTIAPKDGMPAENTYSSEAVMILNTHRTPIQKQPEALLCLVGLSRRYYLGDEVYPTFLYDDDWDMDLFSLIRAPNPTKVKIGSRPRAAHEVPLLTITANRVIEMEDPAATTDSSRVPSTIEMSPLDFANENPSQQSTGPENQKAAALEVPPSENVTTMGVAPEEGQAEGVAATGPHVVKEFRKRGHDGVDTNAPTKVLRRDHVDPRPTKSTRGGKSLAAIELGISFKRAAAAGDSESENTSFISMDLVDHIAPPGYFLELSHLHNDDFLKQYNVNLAPQVAMGSQLRLRFEQEAKLLKKYVAPVARQDKRIQARENEIKNLETLLEAETDMKKAAKNRTQVMGEEKLKAAFEEFKQYENNRVEQRCAKMDARLDALSVDFDEELYPHMLTAIAGRRWVIGHGLRLAVMKCGESTEIRQAFADVVSAGIAKGMSEGLKQGVEHGKANLSLEAIEAYDPEAEAKYIAALHALKDLKYLIVDLLESLKDAPMDVIMASLHLESDTGDDAPQWIRELRPSSSQLTIPVYPEARDPTDPWACKEEIFLADAIAANVSRVERRKSAEWYVVRTGSDSRITLGPMVFRYMRQPLLLK
nr:putative transposase (putative), gypsy type [Tanacetum cinerariifolium]GEZ92893.1 putative transposase (putative), gypsy type [Tanacetum cinerariifolium]